MGSNSDEADFLSLGKHCQEPSCRQIDFLPFRCDCCQKIYCLEHRTVSAHDCPKASEASGTSMVCPLCARLVKVPGGEDPNEVFDRHTRGACEPSNYAKVNKKPKCPVSGCKERLNLVNTHICKHCSLRVCLKHRYADDHNCPWREHKGTPGKAAGKPLLSQLLDFGSTLPDRWKASGQSELPPIPKSESGKPLNSSRGASASRKSHSVIRAQAADLRRDKGHLNLPESSAREECPICHKYFPDVNSLISHSKDHTSFSESKEICPHCRAAFPDAVTLVEHVERHHTEHKGCVVC